MDAGMLAYKLSFDRFFKIGEEAGVDGYIANHPYRDQTFIDGKAEQDRGASSPQAGGAACLYRPWYYIEWSRSAWSASRPRKAGCGPEGLRSAHERLRHLPPSPAGFRRQPTRCSPSTPRGAIRRTSSS